MTKQKKRSTSQKEGTHFLAHFIVSMIVGIILLVVLLAVLAKVICNIDVPLHLMIPIATIALCIAVLPASILFAYLRGEKGLLNGAILSLVFLVVIWGIALMKGQIEFSTLAALKSLVLLTSGAAGGYSGVLLRERKRRIR